MGAKIANLADELGIRVENMGRMYSHVNPRTGKRLYHDANGLLNMLEAYRAQRYQESLKQAWGCAE